MDLSVFETFLYMLMVVALYTAPIAIGLLVFGYFKGFLKKAALTIAVGLPALALILLLSFYLENDRHRRDLDKLSDNLAILFPESTQNVLLAGRVIGSELIGDYNYRLYQFDLPSLPQSITIRVPPPDVTSAATIWMSSPMASRSVAYLLISTSGNSYGPQNHSPAEYLDAHFPSIPNDEMENDDLLILRAYPSASSVLYFTPGHERFSWRNQIVLFEWESFSSHID